MFSWIRSMLLIPISFQSQIFSLRAVTGLKDRHSMRLERFFHAFGQHLFHKLEGLLRILVHVDTQNLFHVRNAQLDHNLS